MLVPGGLLLVLVPNIRHYFRMYELFVRGHFPRTSGDPEGIDGGHLHYFTFSDLQAMLQSAGFTDVRLRGTNGIRFLPALRSLDIFAIARRST